MDMLMGVDADDDFNGSALAHVGISGRVQELGDPASGQDCDGTGILKLLLSHVLLDRRAPPGGPTRQRKDTRSVTRGVRSARRPQQSHSHAKCEISYETVRRWVGNFGPAFAKR